MPDPTVTAALERADHTSRCETGAGFAAARAGGYLSDNPHPWESPLWHLWRDAFTAGQGQG